MKFPRVAAIAAGLALLSGCVAPVGPVQVTRFHTGQAGQLGSGGITVMKYLWVRHLLSFLRWLAACEMVVRSKP